jgi:hypothetical protein
LHEAKIIINEKDLNKDIQILQQKLKKRNIEKFHENEQVEITAHPMFKVRK